MPRSQLDPADAEIIRKAANQLFGRCIGSLASEEIDKLLAEQKVYNGPIHLASGEMMILGSRYRGVVRSVAAEYAARLASAVGVRKGMGKPQCKWVEQQVQDFVRRLTSCEFARTWFVDTVSSLFTLGNEQGAEAAFLSNMEAAYSDDRLISDAKDQIRQAVAIHGKRRRYRRSNKKRRHRSLSEILADPKNHPTMSVEQTQDAIHMSRSSVYRLINEGRLDRASAGKGPDRRSRCLVLTRSVKRFLRKCSY